jgi:hypothetical protein
MAVGVLLMLSDFHPQASSLSELDNGSATLSVVVLRCRPCEGGHLLDIADGVGGEATAFCSDELMTVPPESGKVVRLTLERSADDPAFLYVQAIVPNGKD